MTNRERMLSLLRDETILFVDYYAAVECENTEVYCTCLKCGQALDYGEVGKW